MYPGEPLGARLRQAPDLWEDFRLTASEQSLRRIVKISKHPLLIFQGDLGEPFARASSPDEFSLSILAQRADGIAKHPQAVVAARDGLRAEPYGRARRRSGHCLHFEMDQGWPA